MRKRKNKYTIKLSLDDKIHNNKNRRIFYFTHKKIYTVNIFKLVSSTNRLSRQKK